jgi:ribosomal protein S18 acetylase RimI-like enzyme
MTADHRIDLVRWPIFGEVPTPIRIEPVAQSQLESLLPLIAAYQRFYEVLQIDEKRNRAFFSRFIAPSEDGMLLGAWRDGELLGYACLYWSFTSLIPAETVLMNDLYVDPATRGQGIGRALIEASAAAGRERGAQRLEWMTQPDNEAAKRLYDSTKAERATWLEYEIPLNSELHQILCLSD